MKNGKLFLGGGGSVEQSFLFDEEFFSFLPRQANILYIPIALRRGSIGYESCVDWFSGLISKHSNERELNFTTALEESHIEALSAFDAVYIGGGNTYYLLNYLCKTGMGDRLAKYLQENGKIYGGSAGAMVLGKDIRTVEEENDRSYEHYAGLNLLGEFSVLCHYQDTMREYALNLSARLRGPILAIPEDSGIVWSQNKIESHVGVFFEFYPDGVVKQF
jgi:dipeptidase E